MNLEEFKKKLEEKGFSKDQIDEIVAGVKADINVKDYCKTEFSAEQMREIRIGLQHGLYVADYAKPELNAEQMWIIRRSKEAGIDTSMFTGSLRRMITAFIAAELGIQIDEYQQLEADQLCEVVLAQHNGMDTKDIPVNELDYMQIHEIILAKQNGYTVNSLLARQEDGKYMSSVKMKEVREGLSIGEDLTRICGPDFNAAQMREIRHGLEDNVCVDVYCNHDMSGAQMRQVRLGLKMGVDVSVYNDPNRYSAAVMRVIRRGLTEGVHPSGYLKEGMTEEDANNALQRVLNAKENVHKSDDEVVLSEDYFNQLL